jgi:hypothetical protein
VVELLRSTRGGGGGSLLGVGPRKTTLLGLSAREGFVARGRSQCEFGGDLWRLATSAGLALKRGPIRWAGGVDGGWRMLRATSILRRALV